MTYSRLGKYMDITVVHSVMVNVLKNVTTFNRRYLMCDNITEPLYGTNSYPRMKLTSHINHKLNHTLQYIVPYVMT